MVEQQNKIVCFPQPSQVLTYAITAEDEILEYKC